MPVIVVGGQCSKVGKTAVGCALIQAVPGWEWTAIKISPHDHAGQGSPFLVDQGTSKTTDTGRYLEAGAERAILISGDVSAVLPRLQAEIAAAEMTLIESNSVLGFLKPDVLLFVIDPAQSDFKESARRWIEHSNALLVRSAVPDTLAPGVPRFVAGPEDWAPAALIAMLPWKLARSSHSF